MMDWCISYWNGEGSAGSSVEAWLDGLSKEQLKSVAKEMRLLQISGNKLRLPHSKALGKGLFELRERRYGLRMYYMFTSKGHILLLNAGSKQTQQRDIVVARQRMQSYVSDSKGVDHAY